MWDSVSAGFKICCEYKTVECCFDPSYLLISLNPQVFFLLLGLTGFHLKGEMLQIFRFLTLFWVTNRFTNFNAQYTHQFLHIVQHRIPPLSEMICFNSCLFMASLL